MAASLRRKLNLVGQLQMLNKATSDDATPTPGYMFDEICKITFQSVGASSDLEEFLLGRLQKKSPHVKYKVLKILKHLVEKGHHGFRQDLQRRTEEIRSCLTFRGAADPLHGDTYNKMVQNNAKELMDSLFDVQDANEERLPPGSRPPPTGLSSRDTSYQPSPAQYQGGGMQPTSGAPSYTTTSSGHYYTEGTVGASGKKMWGMGNSPMKDEPTSLLDRVKTKISEFAEGSSSSGPPSMSAPPPSSGYGSSSGSKYTGFGGGGGGGSGGSGYDPSLAARPIGSAPPSGSYAGGRPAMSSASSPYHAPTMGYSAPSSVVEGDITRDSGYEARVVDEVTAPGGVRVAPPQDVLQKFVTRCASLDCHKVIAELLGQKLDSDDNRTALRTLYVIEALCKSDIIAICECIRPLQPKIEAFSGAQQLNARQQAAKILRCLQRSAAGPAGHASEQPLLQQPQHGTAAPAVSTNVLDLDFGGPQSAPAAAAPAAGGGSMFSGMAVFSEGNQPPAAAPAQTAPAQPVPPAAQPAAVSSMSTMFAGMSFGPPSATPGTAAPAAASATAPATSSFGFMGSSSAPAPAPAQVTPATSNVGGGALIWEEPSVEAAFDPLGLLDGSGSVGSSASAAPPLMAVAAPAQPPPPYSGGGMLQPMAPSSMNGGGLLMPTSPSSPAQAAGGLAPSSSSTASAAEPFSFVASEMPTSGYLHGQSNTSLSLNVIRERTGSQDSRSGSIGGASMPMQQARAAALANRAASSGAMGSGAFPTSPQQHAMAGAGGSVFAGMGMGAVAPPGSSTGGGMMMMMPGGSSGGMAMGAHSAHAPPANMGMGMMGMTGGGNNGGGFMPQYSGMSLAGATGPGVFGGAQTMGPPRSGSFGQQRPAAAFSPSAGSAPASAAGSGGSNFGFMKGGDAFGFVAAEVDKNRTR